LPDYFSELNAVKEHDRLMMQQAQQVQQDVSFFFHYAVVI
jgi:hypothetical protein